MKHSLLLTLALLAGSGQVLSSEGPSPVQNYSGQNFTTRDPKGQNTNISIPTFENGLSSITIGEKVIADLHGYSAIRQDIQTINSESKTNNMTPLLMGLAKAAPKEAVNAALEDYHHLQDYTGEELKLFNQNVKDIDETVQSMGPNSHILGVMFNTLYKQGYRCPEASNGHGIANGTGPNGVASPKKKKKNKKKKSTNSNDNSENSSTLEQISQLQKENQQLRELNQNLVTQVSTQRTIESLENKKENLQDSITLANEVMQNLDTQNSRNPEKEETQNLSRIEKMSESDLARENKVLRNLNKELREKSQQLQAQNIEEENVVLDIPEKTQTLSRFGRVTRWCKENRGAFTGAIFGSVITAAAFTWLTPKVNTASLNSWAGSAFNAGKSWLFGS